MSEVTERKFRDFSYMLTGKDVLPTDARECKKFLKKKESAPLGKLRDIYHTRENGALVRKIFLALLRCIIEEVAMGNCKFVFPNNSKATIQADWSTEYMAKTKVRRQVNSMDIDFIQSEYRLPYIKMLFNNKAIDEKKRYYVYVDKSLYAKLVDTVNKGNNFSRRPRGVDYFLPYIYQEFPYIEEHCLKNLAIHGFSSLLAELHHGEEVRFRDLVGEVRFFRPLGKDYKIIMDMVVKSRIARKQNKLYEEFYV